MKKTIHRLILPLVLALTLLLGSAPLAAPQDRNLVMENETNYFSLSAAQVGERLLIIGQKGLYTWQPPMEAPQLATTAIKLFFVEEEAR